VDDLFTVLKNVEQWIMNFLSKPNSAFGGLPPCPWAKKAWLEENVWVEVCNDIATLPNLITSVKETMNARQKEVGLIALDPVLISPDELSAIVSANSDAEFEVLEDHPAALEEIDGVCLNHGKYALIFIQKNKKLKAVRDWLSRTDYYKNWPIEYYNEVTRSGSKQR
jgi:TusA-related sulfurtransferase